MSHNSNDRESKDKERQEKSEEDLDSQLDDFDDEIIDLLDPLEGDGSESDDSSAHAEILDEDRALLFEDFDLQMEVWEDEPSVGSNTEPFEDGEGKKTDSSNEMVSELGELLEGEGETGEGTVQGMAEDDLFTDDDLAELFSSQETEVAKLLEEATGSPLDEEVSTAAVEPFSEEELPEDLFSDLEMEAEGGNEAGDAAQGAPFSEEELPEDLFADLEMKAEGGDEAGDAAEVAPAAEEELAAAPVADFAGEMDIVIKETVAGASVLAAEEKPEEMVGDLRAEPEEVDYMGIPEEIAQGAAEDLAALVSGKVEEVVTRLVEERLPAIVERLLAQEIEKIKSSLESGE